MNRNHIKSIIIWGPETNNHLYLRVLTGYYRAAKFLGFPVEWHIDCLHNADKSFEDAMVISEGTFINHLPLRKNSAYAIFNCRSAQEKSERCGRLLTLDHLQDQITHCGVEELFDKDSAISHDIGVFSDPKSFGIDGFFKVYTAFASDLLPHEIDFCRANISRGNSFNYIGPLIQSGFGQNQRLVEQFYSVLKAYGTSFKSVNPWKERYGKEQLIQLISDSILFPDLNSPMRLRLGIKSQRLIEAISYGQLGLTNSLSCAEFVGPEVLVDTDIATLAEIGLKSKDDRHLIRRQMELIKSNHTYLNRLNGLLDVLG